MGGVRFKKGRECCKNQNKHIIVWLFRERVSNFLGAD